MTLTRRGRAVRFAGIVVGSSAFFTLGLILPHPSTAELRVGQCPPGSSLVSFEDGSGACYAPDDDRNPVRDTQGREIAWPEDTFPWDCRTMGNRECGGAVDTEACAPVGSPAALSDGCPSKGDE